MTTRQASTPGPDQSALRAHLTDVEVMRQCALYSQYARIKPRCARMFMEARAYKGIPLGAIVDMPR